MQDHNVLNRVAEVWEVFSEPVEMPTDEEYQRDWVSRVHGVFDTPQAAAHYADVLFHHDHSRCYGYRLVDPLRTEYFQA